MRLKEFAQPLEELATEDHRKEMDSLFTQHGYEKIGSGVDAMVYKKDDSHVIKIIFPSKIKDMSNATRAFMVFYNYVKQNPSKFLPKFTEVNDIEVMGESFLQIDMEKLQPIQRGSLDQYVVYSISGDAPTQIEWADAVDTMLFKGNWSFMHPSEAIETVEKIKSLPPQQLDYYEELYNVMVDLVIVMNENGFSWDLHTENVMQRADGTLVITDPWVAT